jgi:hypothetical protein
MPGDTVQPDCNQIRLTQTADRPNHFKPRLLQDIPDVLFVTHQPVYIIIQSFFETPDQFLEGLPVGLLTPQDQQFKINFFFV